MCVLLLCCRLFSCLVDCAVFFNTHQTVGSEGEGSRGGSLVTLLLARDIVSALEDGPERSHRGSRAARQQVDSEIVELASTARQHGIEVDSLVRFHKRWQRAQS